MGFSVKQKLKKTKQRYYDDPTQIKEPQYRQPGLPSKTASERKKHQKEIQKLQQIFSKGVVHKRQQNQNKFGELLSPSKDASNSISSSPKTDKMAKKKERRKTTLTFQAPNLLNKMIKNNTNYLKNEQNKLKIMRMSAKIK